MGKRLGHSDKQNREMGIGELIRCIRGPRLFRILRNEEQIGRNYEPGMIESGSDKVISAIRFCWSVTYWTSPFVVAILYRRGYFTHEGILSLTRFVVYASTVYLLAVISRGVGRYMNSDYLVFMDVLSQAQKIYNADTKRMLARYDFQFHAWPVDWRWDSVNSGEAKRVKVYADSDGGPAMSLLTFPKDVLSYICAHTFGRRMVFPGATALINALVEGPLNAGRAKLLEEDKGTRAKLLTEDKNEIDTMFVDRRSRGLYSNRGKTLVVCCEGNAAFYEIGAMATPMDLGYSVLGWNHPGFAGSTGIPFPSQEQCAIDSVMQYAIHKLGFTPDNIVLFAWSIGGYTASWAAMNYPDIQFVILDATFDKLMPLAEAKMPAFAKPLTETTINRYLNMDTAGNLVKYPGPVLLIRRSRDEMITTNYYYDEDNVEKVNMMDPTAIETNRGNFLLMSLLQYRYPNIVDNTSLPALEEWLSKDKHAQQQIWSSNQVDEAWCATAIRSYVEAHSDSFPLQIGTDYTEQQKIHMTLFLASKYMEDFDTTHCTPLPGSFFKKPWTH